MAAQDFVKHFDELLVGYFIDTYVNNYLEVVGLSPTDTSVKSYKITVPSALSLSWIGVNFYN
jgi:hypothetical protein